MKPSPQYGYLPTCQAQRNCGAPAPRALGWSLPVVKDGVFDAPLCQLDPLAEILERGEQSDPSLSHLPPRADALFASTSGVQKVRDLGRVKDAVFDAPLCPLDPTGRNSRGRRCQVIPVFVVNECPPIHFFAGRPACKRCGILAESRTASSTLKIAEPERARIERASESGGETREV